MEKGLANKDYLKGSRLIIKTAPFDFLFTNQY